MTLFARAQRISILAGAGVEHDSAAADLSAAAERWSIPVATTLRAKGVFPEDHDLSLGVFGYAGTRHATAALFDPDLEVLLILGSGLNERDTMHWTLRQQSKALIIHINTDMWEMTSQGKADHVVPGSCRAFLELLATAPPVLSGQRFRKARPIRQSFDREREGSTEVLRPRELPAIDETYPSRRGSDDFARCVFHEMASSLSIPARTGPSQAIIGRLTNPGPTSQQRISAPWAGRSPRPSACNAPQPGRRVAVITGDGCMQMHGLDVQTAARYGLPIIYVVLNNNALGNVWLRAHQYGAAAVGIDHHPRSRLGRLCPRPRRAGPNGAKIQRRLARPSRKALAANTTVLIDVKADKNCPTPVYDFSAGARAWSYHE